MTARAMQQQVSAAVVTLLQHLLKLLLLAAVVHGQQGGDGRGGGGATGGEDVQAAISDDSGVDPEYDAGDIALALGLFIGVCCLCSCCSRREEYEELPRDPVRQLRRIRRRVFSSKDPPGAHTTTAAGEAAVAEAKRHWETFVSRRAAVPAGPLRLPPLGRVHACLEPVGSTITHRPTK